MAFDALTLARTAGVIVAILVAGLVLFQLALALGAPWGRAAYGGRSSDLPAKLRIVSAIAAVVWTAVGLFVVRRAGLPVWAPVPPSWSGPLIWIVLGVLVIAVFLNAITPSAQERAIWLPVSVLLAASTLTIVLTTDN